MNTFKVRKCELTNRSFLIPNTTSTINPEDSSAALDIIYGPVLPGVCGGVVALMTIVGFGEFLRRRRIFQKLRRRWIYQLDVLLKKWLQWLIWSIKLGFKIWESTKYLVHLIKFERQGYSKLYVIKKLSNWPNWQSIYWFHLLFSCFSSTYDANVPTFSFLINEI